MKTQTTVLSLLQKMRASAIGVLRAIDLEGVLPIDTDEVAKRLGISVKYMPQIELSKYVGNSEFKGASLKKDEKYGIALGNNWPENTKRFALAHEIGHIILHPNNLSHVKKQNKQEETEANNFAAELLMPAEDILRNLFIPSVDLAKTFKVSPRAIQIRVAYLINNYDLK